MNGNNLKETGYFKQNQSYIREKLSPLAGEFGSEIKPK